MPLIVIWSRLLSYETCIRYQQKKRKSRFKKRKKSGFYNSLLDGMCSFSNWVRKTWYKVNIRKWLKEVVFLTCAAVCFLRYLKPLGPPKKVENMWDHIYLVNKWKYTKCYSSLSFLSYNIHANLWVACVFIFRNDRNYLKCKRGLLLVSVDAGVNLYLMNKKPDFPLGVTGSYIERVKCR